MNKGNLLKRLVFINLRKKSYRTIAFMILTGILAFDLFGAFLLTISIKNGVNNLNERMGADFIVVPLGYDSGMESILLKGEPSYFYLEKEYVALLQDTEGIEKVSPQFYLTSMAADCCDFPIQIIGFEPETDFTVTPWIKEIYDNKLSDGEVIVGSKVDAEDKITFYGSEYAIAARLDETGTGLDLAVYGNRNTLLAIYASAKEQGYTFMEAADPENYVSSIMVEIADGYDAETVIHNIHQKTTSIQIIQTNGITSKVETGLNEFVKIMYVVGGLLFIIVFVTLSIVFSVTVKERKKELAVLRTIGMSRKMISNLLFKEFFIISAVGSIIGVVLAALVVLPFNTYIGEQIGIPYMLPDVTIIILLAGIVLVMGCAVGPIAGIFAIRKINKNDTWLLIKEKM